MREKVFFWKSERERGLEERKGLEENKKKRGNFWKKRTRLFLFFVFICVLMQRMQMK